MMIRAIFCDLDRTLLDDLRQVSKKNYLIINKAKEKGIKFFVDSGRLPYNFTNLDGVVDLDNFVSCNGSLIKVDGKYIREEVLDKSDVFKLVEKGKELGVIVRVFCIDDVYSLEKITTFNKFGFFSKSADEEMINKIINEQNIYKVCFFSKEREKLEEIQKYIKDNLTKTKSVFSAPFFLENHSYNVSKGEAIERICEVSNYLKDEILCIGDNENDMSMFDRGFHSACPKNAIEEVKEKCEYVSPFDNNKSAVGDIVEYFLNK